MNTTYIIKYYLDFIVWLAILAQYQTREVSKEVALHGADVARRCVW